MPTAGSFTYNSVTTSTTAISLEKETRFSWVNATTDRVELWVNADKDAQPQVETLTVDNVLPVSDAYYRIAIAGPTVAENMVYVVEFLTAESGVTSSTIATRIARLIDIHPDVSAVASGNTVVITSVLPGTNGNFTATPSCLQKSNNSAISSKITTATTQTASGTGKVRKWAQFDLEVGVNANALPEITVKTGIWYNGAASPSTQGTFGPLTMSGPLTADALRAVT